MPPRSVRPKATQITLVAAPLTRIAALRSEILKAKQAYYYGSEPLMSDARYDALEDELRALSPGDPVLELVGAPVPPDNILQKAKHRIPMGSQSKVNSAEEYKTWYEKSAPGAAVQASLKGDGASAAAYYEAGRLQQVISRGDGFEGEDITANALKFKGLPAYAADSDGREFNGAVRFEVILTVEDWGRVDPERSKNPRNAGSGIMGRKNGEQSQLLSAFAFSLDEQRDGESVVFESEEMRIERLKELGFQTLETQLCEELPVALAYFEKVKSGREHLPFWIDGVVFKVNNLAQQEALGTTANRPKGQVAWKFDSQGAETTLLAYSLSVGHTGAIIPTAQLAPVTIGGTTVSNALLNNWDEIARLDVAVGDQVWLIKANDIIPKIVNVLERPPSRRLIPEPTVCPACESLVRRRRNTGGETGAVIECSNADCPAKALGKVKRWVKALDIQGVGESVLRALVEQLGMEDAAALYRLRNSKPALAQLVIHPDKDLRLGEKRAGTILEQIEQARHLTLVQFLGALGIQHLAARRVELIIQQVGEELGTLEAWRSGKLRDEAFAARAGVPSVGAAICESLEQLSPVIDALLDAGVVITGLGTSVGPAGGGAADALQAVCISGKLPSGKKKADYEPDLSAAGFRLVDAVTSETRYLVLADPASNSSKAQKALKLGIEVIGEGRLLELIKQGPRR
ncbi:MAG: NAD-dependent ligase LigA [Pseudomonadota bacterium]|jgi:DNA ligase (NAD+)